MGSGERPIGAAKGKQSDTEALCHPPPPRDPDFIERKNEILLFLVHERFDFWVPGPPIPP